MTRVPTQVPAWLLTNNSTITLKLYGILLPTFTVFVVEVFAVKALDKPLSQHYNDNPKKRRERKKEKNPEAIFRKTLYHV
jgi:hypothetical protein